jgi:hypothetical protein
MRRASLRSLLGAALGVAAVCASAGAGAWTVAVGSEVPKPALTSTLADLPHEDDGGEGTTDNDPGNGGEAVPEPPPDRLATFRAPLLGVPLPDLDPGLARRGPRPTVGELMRYQYGVPSFLIDPRAAPDDWRLARPDPTAVRGFAEEVSVGAGQSLGLRLNGSDATARLDVFRMGRGDAQHYLTLEGIPIEARPEAAPRAGDGLVEELWPRTTSFRIPAGWPSGVYLIKLTGNSGGQSYIPFVVRSATASALTVVLPITTYQAYNVYGGASLYSWPNGENPRAYEVSFNRPFVQEYGAGLFFRLDFPLIVWLENHGYSPSYIADVDLARLPLLVQGSKTIVFSGHGEYWARAARNNVEGAAAGGTNLAFFGANQAFWQIRLASDSAGRANRTVICYKSATLDPVAARAPGESTTRFQDPPVLRPPSDLMGLQYAGVVDGIAPMVVGDGILAFDPNLGLLPGQQLPGLIADEVDGAPRGFNGLLLSQTQVVVHGRSGATTAASALWVAPAGYRVFDAGTFDFSWGLDPRYAAALPGFPSAAYARLTAEILAWLGARPTI